MDVVYTTISPEYCPAWGIKEALRELIQEGLDVEAVHGCQVSFSQENGYFIIKDNGPGLEMSSLVMGISTKRGHEATIGQFGEGLKLACLVLARLGRYVLIESRDRQIKPVIDKSPVFNCDVLAFVIEECSPRVGTIIKVQASEEEVKEAMGLFLRLSNKDFYVPGAGRATESDRIFLPGGYIFVQGVVVTVPDRSAEFLFSYNFKNKELQGRDRWAIDLSVISGLIREVWATCSNAEMIKMLLEAIKENKYSYLEVSRGLVPSYLTDSYKDVWQEVTNEVFHKVLIKDTYDNPQLERVKALGYEVVDVHYRVRELLAWLGVGTVTWMNKQLGLYEAVGEKKLSPLQKYNLKQVRKLTKKYISPDIEILPVRYFCSGFSGQYGGGNKVYLNVDVLKDSYQAMKTVVHEYAHYSSSADDYTDSFQSALEGMVVDLILGKEAK